MINGHSLGQYQLYKHVTNITIMLNGRNNYNIYIYNYMQRYNLITL